MNNVRRLDRNRRKRVPAPKHWQHGLTTTYEGIPNRGLANVLHIFSRHPAWADVLAYDAFLECVIKIKAPPVREQDGTSQPGEWTETDTSRAVAWFASNVDFEPSTVHIEQAVATVAERNVVHPVRDYLRALSWDGEPRLDGLLSTYFGAPNTPYTRAIGARWMISGVARVMNPGCQVDCMLVLESSQQGMGKSTGLEALTGQEWFADTGINIGDKDSYQALRGKWIYEFGELDSIKGREATKVKNFVSARVDTYRPSYGRRTKDFKRQNVFAGTTNEDTYLADRTGNRRFWPVQCGRIDVARIRSDRDQLWAEAVARYSQGEPWHVDTPELRALCAAEQRGREIEDAWAPLVARWIAEQTRCDSAFAARGITTTDVIAKALSIEPSGMNQGLSIRVGHVLRALGWEPRQSREHGAQVRRYYPASQTSQGGSSHDSDGDHPESRPDPMLSQMSQTQINPRTQEQPQSAKSRPSFDRDDCDARAADALERLAIEDEGCGRL